MIYLDHNATTPLHPDVLKAMEPYLKEQFGNASSYYRLGREAKTALQSSRPAVACCIDAKPHEIIFTSGGTEADNLALRGVAHALKAKGNHIITSSIEHHAVLRTCEDLAREGFRITYLPVDGNGIINPDDVRNHITSRTILISVMLANNETGVIQPISEIGAIAKSENIIFHTDAVQALGKIPVDVNNLSVDLLSVSGHKFYGPKGGGALFIRQGTPLIPLLTGGHHEHNLRAGTENVPAIAGLARALEIAVSAMTHESQRLSWLRNYLEAGILQRIGHVQINGVAAPRLPHTTNISFLGIDGESILLHLDLRGICASTGSACTTGAPEPSHVLNAMGVPPHVAQGSIRFSLGKDNTEQEADTVVDALVEITSQLRAITSLNAV